MVDVFSLRNDTIVPQ